MSLRDLATASACAPDGAAGASGAASSSLNPLAQLADAVLPRSLNPHPSAGASSSSGPRAGPSALPAEEASILRGQTQSSLEALPSIPVSTPSSLPPPLFPTHPHVLQQPPPPPPLPPFAHALTPLPQPAPGAPTDVFERAFRSAAGPAGASSRTQLPAPPSPMHPAPFSSLHTGLSTLSLAPPPTRLQPYSAYAAPPLSQLPMYTPILPPLASAAIPTHMQPEVTSTAAKHTTHIDTPSASTAANLNMSAATHPAATTENKTVLPSSVSWGDEFTSFETGDMSTAFFPPASDDPLFDRSIDALYANWLEASASQAYSFRNTATASETTSSARDVLAAAMAARDRGRLTAAVGLFEMALNRAPGEELAVAERASAWFFLGLSLADSDDDARAIQAFEQGLSLYSDTDRPRERHPLLGHTLMALAVSHTNEADSVHAMAAVREWLDVWRRERGGNSGRVTTGRNESGKTTMTDEGMLAEHDALVKELYAMATEATEDVEVLIMIGIVHNVKHGFDRAAHALRRAVHLRQEDCGLWNKLGATLANGGKHEEALRAYRKAVDLNPTLIRAWVNVGTAYTNRGEYAKAARYYLKAVALGREQGEGGGGGMEGEGMRHVWGYVKSTLITMDRGDLLDLAQAENLEGLRVHFNF